MANYNDNVKNVAGYFEENNIVPLLNPEPRPIHVFEVIRNISIALGNQVVPMSMCLCKELREIISYTMQMVENADISLYVRIFKAYKHPKFDLYGILYLGVNIRSVIEEVENEINNINNVI